MKAHHLPAVQYTARDVRSGLQFLAYASRRSAQASELFAERIQKHLRRWGVNLRDVTWQTDNGSEFIGELQPHGSRSHFPHAVTFFGSQHERIPPGAHTYQSDVETVHHLIEDEFFDLETFPAAPNSSAKLPFISSISTWRVPILTSEASPHGRSSTSSPLASPLNSACFPPFLDYRLDSQGGYHLPRYPYT